MSIANTLRYWCSASSQLAMEAPSVHHQSLRQTRYWPPSRFFFGRCSDLVRFNRFHLFNWFGGLSFHHSISSVVFIVVYVLRNRPCVHCMCLVPAAASCSTIWSTGRAASTAATTLTNQSRWSGHQSKVWRCAAWYCEVLVGYNPTCYC